MNTPHTSHPRRGRLKDAVLQHFRGWHEPIETIVAATEDAAITQYDIRHMLPLRRWSRGRATLLGDAAHSMTPDLAQGACMAIEDGVALAAALARTPDVAAALRAYEANRKGRATAIMALSGIHGWVAQWQNAAACVLRDAALSIFPVPVAWSLCRWVMARGG